MNIKSFSLPVFLWLLCFICALYPLNQLQLFFFTVSVLSLFAWSYTALSRKMAQGWSLPRSPVLLFAGLFWLLTIASVFWSEVKPVSLIAIAVFAALPLTFFISVIQNDEDFFKKIAWVLGVVFGVLALWAIFQFFFLNIYFYGQARHPLADPSSLGALFSLALFCALGFILTGIPSRARGWVIGLALLLACGIISTVSRAPVIAFIPGFILLCLFVWPQIKANRKALLLILTGAIAFYGLTLTGVQNNLDLGSRLLGLHAKSFEQYGNNRLDIWSSAVEMIKDRPLLGSGFGTFFLYYPEYRHETEFDGASFAHNDPLQFWTELGVLGPLLLYAFAGAAIFRSFTALKKLKGEDEARERVIVASLFAGLVSLIAGAHIGFSLYNMSILLLAGLMLGYWFMVTGRALNDPVRVAVMPDTLPMAVNRILLALPFVLMAWLIASLMAGEAFANRASKDLFEEQVLNFAEDINMANRVSQGMNTRAYLLAVNVPMSILDFKKDQLSDEEKKNLYDQIAGYMHDVLAINPRSSSAYFYLGKVQTLVPASVIPPDALTLEECYKKAIALNPMHIGARIALSDHYEKTGRSIRERLAIMAPGEDFRYATPLAGDYYNALSKLYLEDKNYVKMNLALQNLYRFQKRSEFSRVRQETSIPQAVMGREEMLDKVR